jgi:GNAT superfamily N-acetyltransferase
MTIVKVTDEIKEKLLSSNFSKRFLDNCFNSNFLAIELNNKKIIGVGFVGGILNSYGIEIIEEFRGKGIGKKLLNEINNKCKKEKFSFLTGVFKPTNTNSVKMHMSVGYVPLFTFYYNTTEGAEIPVILPFNKKGLFLIKLFKICNTRFGNFLFALILSFLQPFLKNLIAFSNNEMPKLDLKYCISNFEKVTKTLEKYGLI